MFNDILGVLERARASGEHVDVSALRCVVNGGAIIPPALMNRLLRDLPIKNAIVRAFTSTRHALAIKY